MSDTMFQMDMMYTGSGWRRYVRTEGGVAGQKGRGYMPRVEVGRGVGEGEAFWC